MKFGVKSDKGRVREINEDSYNIIAGYPNIPVAFIIADGMGGHNSGEIASNTAVEYVSNYILEFPDAYAEDSEVPEAIVEMMLKANTTVYNMSKQSNSNFGMGTTLIVVVIVNKRLYIGHIGDSRVYLIREGDMNQITTDHSYIEELIRNGTLTKKEAENHPKKNIITRALGCSDRVEVDTYSCNFKENDSLILCTDGLTNMLDDNTIKEIVEKHDDPEQACEELIQRANEKGGEDNITVILIKNS